MKKSLFVLILIGGWVIPSWAQNNKEFEQLCKKYQQTDENILQYLHICCPFQWQR